MPLDTATNRAAAVHLGMPWRSASPFPSGGLNQGERQMVAFAYSGIAAVGGVEDEGEDSNWIAAIIHRRMHIARLYR